LLGKLDPANGRARIKAVTFRASEVFRRLDGGVDIVA
jgi:hypothetical protein